MSKDTRGRGGGLGEMDNVQTPAAFLTKEVNDNSVLAQPLALPRSVKYHINYFVGG